MEQSPGQGLPPANINNVAGDGTDHLRGLKGVTASVDGLVDGARLSDQTRESLQATTDLSLRHSGVPVLTEKERSATPGYPSLYVNINVVGLAFSISVELKENVRLERDPHILVFNAAIWETCGIGHGDANYIIKGVERYVDKFGLAYLKANPK